MKNSGQPQSKITQDVSAKHFRNLDSKIRKKWNKLYEYRKGRNRSPQQCNGYTKKNSVEASLNISLNCSFNPHSVQQIKAEKNRIATHQRYKKNNQIFFQKKHSFSLSQQDKNESSNSLNLKEGLRICPNYNSNKIELNKQNKQQKGMLPFLLQRRKKTVERSMDIIDHISQLSISQLNSRQKTVFERHCSQQRKLFQKMKGTKVFYQFIKEWKVPTIKTEF